MEGGSEGVFEGGFEEGLPRGCFGEVAKGSSGRVSGRFFRKASKGGIRHGFGRLQKGFGTRGALRRPPKGVASGWHVPKGLRKDFREGLRKRLGFRMASTA